MRAVLLTNFVPPYRVSLYQELARRFESFNVLTSTPMEPNRNWKVDWGDLDVAIQKSVAIRGSWQHPHGFNEAVWVHVPYDTLPRLARLRPDVVISAEMGPRTLQAALYTWLRPSARLVLWATVSEHSEQGRGIVRESLRRVLLRLSDAVVVNGASGARYVTDRGARPDRIFRAPYTTDMASFFALPTTRTETADHRLLYVGQLTERKGILPFLRCLSTYATMTSDRFISFTIVGVGPLEQALRDTPTPPNLRLEFFGSVEYGQLPDVYARSGVLAFPTLADEWGVVVNEAMASGVPVLGSNFSQAVEELVDEGSTGWRFAPEDPHGMIYAVARALSTPSDQLAAMRRNARARIASVTPAHSAAQVFMAAQRAVEPRGEARSRARVK